MIKDLFSAVVNMSVTGSVAITLVVMLRFAFRKMPKIYSYMLWGIVLFRLLCPYSLSLDTSVFNVLPATQSENGRIEYRIAEKITEEIPVINESKAATDKVYTTQPETVATPAIGNVTADNRTENLPVENKIVINDTTGFDLTYVIPFIWLGGAVYFLCINLISLLETRKLLQNSVHIKDNIYRNSHIPTAFIMGLIKPKIYLPQCLDAQQREYVTLHEQTHIKRKDYIFKIAGFVALCLHWFNPAVWLAFRMAENDMEMACDEAVIKNMSRGEKRRYSMTLLGIGTKQQFGKMAIAFSEGETKYRIKNVLGYIKPKQKYIFAVVAVICGAVALLVFNPASPSVYSVGAGKEKCSEIVLTSGDNYRYITDENCTELAKQLKKTKVTAVDTLPDVTKFTSSVIFITDGLPKKVDFDESCKYMAVESVKDRETTIAYYRLENPGQAAAIADEIFKQSAEFKPVQITYPIFDESANYDVEITPFTVSFELPANLHIADIAKYTHYNWHNTVEIYDNGGNQAGDISFCTHLSTDGYANGNFPTRYNLENTSGYEVLYDNEKGHLLKVNYGNDTIFYIYDVSLNCIVKLHLFRVYNSEESVDKISETLSMAPAAEGSYKPADNRPKFRVKPDVSREEIAYTAAQTFINSSGDKYDYKLLSARVLNEEEINEILKNNSENNRDFTYEYIVELNFKIFKKGTGQQVNMYDEKSTIIINKYRGDRQENYVIDGWAGLFNDFAPHIPITEVQTVETERIATVNFGIETIKDDTKNLGTSEVLKDGERGIEKQVIQQQVVNGVVIKETVLDSVTLKEPVDTVVSQGTLLNGTVLTGGNGKLIWPTAAGRVARGFVDQYPAHNGIDIAGPIGTFIYAAADGIVTKALYTNNGYGVYLEIEHGGYQTLYGQCSRLLVSVGQDVKQGQIVAYMGSTGNSTGPHLHFEVKEGNNRFDPYKWF